MLDISVIVLTFNEERHIRRCITKARKFSNKIYVIDSYSKDRTCELARESGAIVIQHAFINQAQQFQWALDNCKIDSEWTLRLDADEYLSEELINEMEEKLPSLEKNITGCFLPLDVIFLGKLLKFGRLHPVQILRLWRTGKVYMEQRWMDERCVLKDGKAIYLKGRFIDHNLNGIGFFTSKHNNYSNREVLVTLGEKYHLFETDDALKSRNSQKSKYYKLPPFFRAFLYFFVRYICFGGFLDGKRGFIWATLQAYWYRFLVDTKLYEIEVRLGKNPSKEDLKSFFKQYYGINLHK